MNELNNATERNLSVILEFRKLHTQCQREPKMTCHPKIQFTQMRCFPHGNN